jgi:hypothetical protein
MFMVRTVVVIENFPRLSTLLLFDTTQIHSSRIYNRVFNGNVKILKTKIQKIKKFRF